VGYGALIAAAWLNIFYIVVLAWAIYYLIASIATELPWASCEHWWNTERCRSYYHVCNVSIATNTTWDCGRGNFTSPVREYWEYVFTTLSLVNASVTVAAEFVVRLLQSA